MAKQVGPLFFTGTIDGIIFYELNGQYYMRSKGDYKSGKQMRKDPAFKRTMANADTFGAASKLVKYYYYRLLPKEARKHGLFGKLSGMVNKWLQGGKSREEAKELLIAYCQSLTLTPPNTIAPKPTAVSNNAQRPTVNAESTPGNHPKQARYLSKWKVKRNGRLQVPRNDGDNLLMHLQMVKKVQHDRGVDPDSR